MPERPGGPLTRFRRSRCLLSFLCACALAVPACAPVGPDFVKPQPDVEAGWAIPMGSGLQAATLEMSEWWRVFKDPVLDELVERARSSNNTLESAALRVLESRARLAIATGQQYPQSQLAFGEANWVSPANNSGVNGSYWQYGLGASASWEMDFWGRFRRGIEAADAAVLASIAAYDQTQVLLTAMVVDTYTVVRVTEEQLRIARENVVIQQRSYDIAAVLFRNGADSELDMQQAKTLLLATQATIPALEAALRQARNALSSLIGLPPGSVDAMLDGAKGIPRVPADIAVGFPGDMLRRRPDVRQAEFEAMAQNARVGLAKADLYPSFSLAGTLSLTAGGPGGEFGDLFDKDALGVSIGPSFFWPFLNYDRIKNNVRVQDVRLQQALVNYRETVLQSARESEDAMAAFIGAREQTAILAETVASAQRSNTLSTLRYKEGFSDYQRVLNAQQALFTQQQRYITIQGDTVRSMVGLFKALGGGWGQRGQLPAIDAGDIEQMKRRTDWGDLIEAAYPVGTQSPESDGR